MFALCACNASCWRYGPASWLISMLRMRSFGSWRASTCVICLPCSVIRTCTVPKRLLIESPSTVRVICAGDWVVGGVVVGGVVVGGAEVAGVVGRGGAVVGVVLGGAAAMCCVR